MRNVLMSLAAIATAACVQGCATPTGGSAAVAVDDGVDHAKMDVIERMARFRGVSVIWVNPPRKPS